MESKLGFFNGHHLHQQANEQRQQKGVQYYKISPLKVLILVFRIKGVAEGAAIGTSHQCLFSNQLQLRVKALAKTAVSVA